MIPLVEPAQLGIWESLLGAQVRFIDAGGIRTRIVEAGEGTPVVLLHGTGGHVEAFARNVIMLAGSHRVIAVDMVGHGLSDKPDIDYVPDDYVDHLETVLDALAIDRAHLVGVSLGAWVATWLALRSPARVLSIVNCTGAVFRWPDGESTREASERKGMVSAGAALAELSEQTVRERLAILFHDPSKCPEELVRIRLALYSTPRARAVNAALHHMLPYDNPDRIAFSLTPARLGALEMPVLYLWGEFNPGGSLDGARRAAEVTPHGELEIIRDTGHWPQFEDPDAFNASTAHFFERVEASLEATR